MKALLTKELQHASMGGQSEDIGLSILSALSLDSVIYAQVIKGSFTASRFFSFIEGLLSRMQPFPAKNSVIVMDNACIYKDPHVLDLIESWCETSSILGTE